MIYSNSANLVKEISKLNVRDNIKLQDYFIFNGIYLWDVVSAYLVEFVFPQAINTIESPHKNIIYPKSLKEHIPLRFRLHLRCLRENLVQLKLKVFLNKKGAYSEKTNNYKIFFLGFEPRQIDCFIPLLDLLKDMDIRIICSRLCFLESRYIIKRENIKYLFIEDFFSSEHRYDFKLKLGILKGKTKNLRKNKIFNNLEYKNAPLWKYLKDYFSELFVYTFPLLLKKLVIADFLIDKEMPNIIVGADDCDPRTRIFFMVGRQRKIPTLHIQYGLASEEATNWIFSSTDKAAVFGEHTVSILRNMGIDEGRLVVTGQPRFDSLISNDNFREMICKEFNISRDKKIIVFASQPLIKKQSGVGNVIDLDEYMQVLECIYNLAREFPNFYILVKPHPDEDLRIHLSFFKNINFKNISLVNKNFNLHMLIKGCDVFLTRSSTSALEALIAGRTTIIINFKKKIIFERFIKEGLFLEVNSKFELREIVRKIIFDSKFQSELTTVRNVKLDKYVFNSDGNAKLRVAELIKEMLASCK